MRLIFLFTLGRTTQESHNGAAVKVLVVQLLILFPANIPWKAVEDCPSI